jgi:hypothetical protein
VTTPSEPRNEVDVLRDECAQYREELRIYRAELAADAAERKEAESDRVKLIGAQLSKDIKEDFLSYVTRFVWIAGILVALGTLGGFFTIRQSTDQRIQEMVSKEIESRQKDFAQLRERAVSDIVDLRVQTAKALGETRQQADSAIADVKKTQAEMRRLQDGARKLILETTRYWEAAKPAIENARGDQRTKPGPANENAKNDEGHLEPADERRLAAFKCITGAGVHDPDVDLWIAVMEDKVDAAKSAMNAGANPVATDTEVLKRHRDVMLRNCPGLVTK